MKLSRFYNLYGKIVRKILEELPTPKPLNPPPPLLRYQPIVVVPEEVQWRNIIVIGEKEVDEEGNHAKAHEQEDVGVMQD